MSNQTTFTVKEIVDPTKEREWASAIGGLDWDKTNIVFTKRTFVEFLRYMGTSVNPNYGNIAKLPRYAQFGEYQNADFFQPAAESNTTRVAEVAPTAVSSTGFIPSRKVSEPPGGKDSLAAALAGIEEPKLAVNTPPRQQAAMRETPREEVQDPNDLIPPPKPKAETDLLGNAAQTTTFKPTRRVREGPGGRDSLADMI